MYRNLTQVPVLKCHRLHPRKMKSRMCERSASCITEVTDAAWGRLGCRLRSGACFRLGFGKVTKVRPIKYFLHLKSYVLEDRSWNRVALFKNLSPNCGRVTRTVEVACCITIYKTFGQACLDHTSLNGHSVYFCQTNLHVCYSLISFPLLFL